MKHFQMCVSGWFRDCFSSAPDVEPQERMHRFLEEALELAQSCDCTREEALQLVDYVFGRPIGEPSQEVGGTMVTLALLCEAKDIDLDRAAFTELGRILQPEIMAKVRAKAAAKPKFSPLPGAVQ